MKSMTINFYYDYDQQTARSLGKTGCVELDARENETVEKTGKRRRSKGKDVGLGK